MDEAAHVGVGRHTERHDQPTERRVLHFDGGLELEPSLAEIAGGVANGDERLDSDDAARFVDLQYVRQVAHVDHL